MGQSTDGILFYGILFEEEDEVPEFMSDAGHDDWDDFIAAKSGLPMCGDEGYSYDAHREYEKALPVYLVTHCSGEYPMYGLAVKGSYFNAGRGYPTILENGLPDITDDQKQAFTDWCNEHEIELQEPKWILCSMWN